MIKPTIRLATINDSVALIDLWQRCGLTRPWNDPQQDIQRALKVWPELFFIIESNDQLIASAMCGYDGHRGAVYYFAVNPSQQSSGLGRYLMDHVEKTLINMGCPKINLCVRSDNKEVQLFYKKLGYAEESTVLMGKRLIRDD